MTPQWKRFWSSCVYTQPTASQVGTRCCACCVSLSVCAGSAPVMPPPSAISNLTESYTLCIKSPIVLCNDHIVFHCIRAMRGLLAGNNGHRVRIDQAACQSHCSFRPVGHDVKTREHLCHVWDVSVCSCQPADLGKNKKLQFRRTHFKRKTSWETITHASLDLCVDSVMCYWYEVSYKSIHFS